MSGDAMLREGLGFLPRLFIAQVPMGYAVSSSAWVWRDGDRCIAYVSEEAGRWRVEDAGDACGARCELDDAKVVEAIAAAGARVDDFTIIFDPATAAAVPGAVTQLLALLWRLETIGAASHA